MTPPAKPTCATCDRSENALTPKGKVYCYRYYGHVPADATRDCHTKYPTLDTTAPSAGRTDDD